MFNDNKRNFLFVCMECDIIMDIGFDDPEDIKKIVEDDDMLLECVCTGIMHVLRN